MEEKSFNMTALGQAFIAYRTVRPKALGNARHDEAAERSNGREYA